MTTGHRDVRRSATTLEAGVFAPAAFGSIATASVVTLLALIAVLVLI
ncbi:hypothetical protein SIM91_19205 [Rhodococcus opacus]|nr:hypothetical protein [Rhodococcus opacus]MDV6247611.1 hypothetical protein [Rhodococcus opacus]MDX5965378.1 hypothetical protein [Rhodococcus opacus]NKY75570.1 hypothetical protein [Rhodococcus opacus]CAG7579871.1 hypothetical protein E143388_00068 [Rhodococcus opacus]